MQFLSLYDDIKSVDAQTDDFEGLVNVGRNLEELKFVVLREELNIYLKNLRANEYVDVAQLSIFSSGVKKERQFLLKTIFKYRQSLANRKGVIIWMVYY